MRSAEPGRLVAPLRPTIAVDSEPNLADDSYKPNEEHAI
jgi:hypothetical protein